MVTPSFLMVLLHSLVLGIKSWLHLDIFLNAWGEVWSQIIFVPEMVSLLSQYH